MVSACAREHTTRSLIAFGFNKSNYWNALRPAFCLTASPTSCARSHLHLSSTIAAAKANKIIDQRQQYIGQQQKRNFISSSAKPKRYSIVAIDDDANFIEAIGRNTLKTAMKIYCIKFSVFKFCFYSVFDFKRLAVALDVRMCDVHSNTLTPISTKPINQTQNIKVSNECILYNHFSVDFRCTPHANHELQLSLAIWNRLIRPSEQNSEQWKRERERKNKKFKFPAARPTD